ncbi:MAG: putative quinol monooxygenase [Nocardioidaceae bacterium]
MSITTVAVITAKPGAGEQVEDALHTLAEASHAEAGCQLYSLHRGLDNRDIFVTVEKWDSRDSLQAHLESPHLVAAMSTAGELLAAPPKIIPAELLPVGDPAKSTY